MQKKIILITTFLVISLAGFAEDGYKLWLRYTKVADKSLIELYSGILCDISIEPSLSNRSVLESELKIAAVSMLNINPINKGNITGGTGLVIGTSGYFTAIGQEQISNQLNDLGADGYLITSFYLKKKKVYAVAANSANGCLYGMFHLLRLMQSGSGLSELPVSEKPRIANRILNHWDNLDRTVERGYAGFSIWDWHKLPDYIDPRYIDYARANASIGINGTVLTNVNSNALVLTKEYIQKVAALADLFRPYGIKVYLTARFSAPIEIGGLSTADPLAPEVQDWWDKKVDEIYKSIPDFGGFLVKANSEGQPGPQNYDRTHADGANMLAKALAPHHGIVMWRAFVYSAEENVDRAKQAYNEFVPMDGLFAGNVLIQVKNGAIDFQPREPFHPMFGAMPKTALALELQITQEYLGQGTQLVYLAPMYKECLDSDTWQNGKGTTVAKVVEGKVSGFENSAIAGVANIGTDRNWTGHLFGQSNWYAFGRLAWNSSLSSEQIAGEWIDLSFGTNAEVKETIMQIMLPSHEAAVNYMTPLGLHHIMGWDNHYGPGPWVNIGRADWTSLYYHRADSVGVGFNRSLTGSNAIKQYAPELREIFGSVAGCPEKYLLWFHHVPWNYKMKSGRTLWDEMCFKYNEGVLSVVEMNNQWAGLENKIDPERFAHVSSLLKIQLKEARWWRNACLLYFAEFSKMPFPAEIELPTGSLEEYKNMKFPYAPGIKPSW